MTDTFFAIRTGRLWAGGNGRVYKMGQRVHVLLDRIDRQQRRLQFALVPGEEDVAASRSLRGLRKTKAGVSGDGEGAYSSPNRSGKRGEDEV
ncbi:MAG: hypothetical protein WDN23_08500 [Edaphobacter sp.]